MEIASGCRQQKNYFKNLTLYRAFRPQIAHDQHLRQADPSFRPLLVFQFKVNTKARKYLPIAVGMGKKCIKYGRRAMIPLVLAVGETISSNANLNTNCAEPMIGTATGNEIVTPYFSGREIHSFAFGN
jgi:hypothetical protein